LVSDAQKDSGAMKITAISRLAPWQDKVLTDHVICCKDRKNRGVMLISIPTLFFFNTIF